MWEGYPKRQLKTVRFPQIMPDRDMRDILASEGHKQRALSKDGTTGQHHGRKAKNMEMAWACHQETPR